MPIDDFIAVPEWEMNRKILKTLLELAHVKCLLSRGLFHLTKIVRAAPARGDKELADREFDEERVRYEHRFRGLLSSKSPEMLGFDAFLGECRVDVTHTSIHSILLEAQSCFQGARSKLLDFLKSRELPFEPEFLLNITFEKVGGVPTAILDEDLTSIAVKNAKALLAACLGNALALSEFLPKFSAASILRFGATADFKFHRQFPVVRVILESNNTGH